MFSYKINKVENLKKNPKNNIKIDFKLKKLYNPRNNKIKNFEYSKSSQDFSDKSNLIRKNNKNNNKRFSKITNNNSSSYFQNKSITTNISERKYGKKLNQYYNTYSNDVSKNNFLIKQINNKKINNDDDKDFENAFIMKIEDKNRKNYNFIFNINKNLAENEVNFKQKEKLKKLKYLIFNFDRKQKTIEQNNNNNNLIINLEKMKKLNFCREKKLNTKYINYDKNNIYLNKKISIKNHNNLNILQKNNLNISNSFEEYLFRTNYKNQHNRYSSTSPRTTSTNSNKTDIKRFIPKINLNNLFLSDDKAINNKNDLYKANNSLTSHYNHITNYSNDNFLFNRKRCYSSHNPNKFSICNILKEKYNKTLFPLTQRLITESNIINEQISKERKFEKLFDYFGEEEMKKVKIEKKNNPIDLKKIRKDINLYNVNSRINETNIVFKGTKRIEKLLTCKKEVKIARNAAQRVINEDLLSNNYFDFDATYNIRLQRLIERRLYSKFVGETMLSKSHMKVKKKEKTDSQKLYKTLKGGLENFFDEKSLKYLIFKSKAIKLKNRKLFSK